MSGLVIGQKGQLGNSLINLINPPSSFRFDSKEKIRASDPNFVIPLILDLKPSFIVNAAAWTEVDSAETAGPELIAANVDIPKNLASVSKILSIPFYQISTDYVFSGNSKKPYEVDYPKEPLSKYGKSKSEGEDIALKIYPKGTRIFRTSWLYSPFRKNFVKTMIKMAKVNKNEISVVSNQFGQPTSSLDLANQIIHSIELDLKPGIYHATNSGIATWHSLAREIFQLIGENANRVVEIDGSQLKRAASRPSYSVLSHNCWKNTGIEPMRDWKIALKEQIEEIRVAVSEEIKNGI